ncbi:MAG: hypothetical protein WC455_16145 [Dehalococcoidia bacterium]
MTQWMKPCRKRKTCKYRRLHGVSATVLKHCSRHEKDELCECPGQLCPDCVPEKKGRKK